MFGGVCGMEHMWIHKCLITWLITQDFYILLWILLPEFLGFCLNLEIVEPFKDMTRPEHFSNQLTFFFSADAHEMRPQLSNYTVKSRRYAGICPLWGSRNSFFPYDCLHMREAIFFRSQSSCANNFCFVSTFTLKWNNLQKTLGGLFWFSPRQMMVD